MDDTFDLDALRNELTLAEGRYTYPCASVIGIGHNLVTHGLSDKIIDAIFAEDIDRTVTILDARLPWWRDLPQGRQRVMIEMVFSAGMGTLQGLRHFLAAMERHDWLVAASELRSSELWTASDERGLRMVARLTGAAE